MCNHVGFLTHEYLSSIVLHQELCLSLRIFVQVLTGLVSVVFVNVEIFFYTHNSALLFAKSTLVMICSVLQYGCVVLSMWVANSQSSL
jgi:hypothetical protein